MERTRYFLISDWEKMSNDSLLLISLCLAVHRNSNMKKKKKMMKKEKATEKEKRNVITRSSNSREKIFLFWSCQPALESSLVSLCPLSSRSTMAMMPSSCYSVVPSSCKSFFPSFSLSRSFVLFSSEYAEKNLRQTNNRETNSSRLTMSVWSGVWWSFEKKENRRRRRLDEVNHHQQRNELSTIDPTFSVRWMTRRSRLRIEHVQRSEKTKRGRKTHFCFVTQFLSKNLRRCHFLPLFRFSSRRWRRKPCRARQHHCV